MRGLEASNKKQGEHYLNYYLVGVMEGALEAHNQAVRNGAKPSICLNGRRLEPHMARSLLTLNSHAMRAFTKPICPYNW